MLLVSDNESVILSNQVGNAILLEIAQQALSIEEIFNKFLQKGVPLPDILQVVHALEKQGYIKEPETFFDKEQAAYWESLGMDTGLLAAVLQQKTINIQAVGRANTTVFQLACEEAHLRLSDAPDLQVILTDDYNSLEISRLNKEFKKNKTPWVLLKSTGTEIWLGPIFIGEQTACWECLRHRLELNNPMNQFYKASKKTNENLPKPTINHPLNARIGAGMAVLEIIKWLYSPKNKVLTRHILSLDTKTMKQRFHTVVKRPQCTVCGDAQVSHPLPVVLKKQEVLVSKLGGYRAVSPKETFEKYKHHVSNISGIISELKPYHNTGDAPVYNYSSGRNVALQSTSLFWLNHHLRSGTGGKGKTEIQAKTGAVCEAIERYSLMYHGDEYTIRGSLDELKNGIDPNMCMNFSEAQLQNRATSNKLTSKFYELTPIPFDASQEMSWTPVYSLSENIFKYLPSCFCYAQYPAEDEKMLYSYPDSNGCAAGNTLEEAILQGFLELIERDAAAIWWYNRIKRPPVDLSTLNNPYLQQVVQYYQTINRSLWVLDITSDLGVPVFVAVSHNLTGAKEEILYAFGAHLDVNIAIERAMIELNQLLPIVLGNEYLTKDAAFIDWLENQSLTENSYLVPLKGEAKNLLTDYPVLCQDNIYDSVLFCMSTTQACGLETLVLDLTRKDVGLPVAKVIVPGLRHFWRRTAPGRLYDVPVKMGWLNKAFNEQELNPVSIFI